MKTKYASYLPKHIAIDELEKLGILKELHSKNPCYMTQVIVHTIVDVLPSDVHHVTTAIKNRAWDAGYNKISIWRIIIKYNLKKYVIRPKRNKHRQLSRYQWNIDEFDKINLISYIKQSEVNTRDKMLSISFSDKIQYELDNMKNTTNRLIAMHYIRRYKYLSIDDSINRNFHMRKNGDVTFLPGNKMSILSENCKWLHDNREKIKLGKALKYMFNSVLSDSQIENINNNIKSRYTFNDRIEIVDGNAILKYYLYTSYANDKNIGTLYDSCMKHKKCQEWLHIYADNKEDVALAVSLDENDKVTGRAIIWKKVYASDGQHVFMDRIYGNDVTQNAFKKYAKEKGWWHKDKQTYSSNDFVNSVGAVKNRAFVQLNNINYMFPYMDSFKYTDDYESNTIELDLYKGNYTLDSINGGPGEEENDDDYAYDRNDDRYHRNDLRYDDINDEYIYYDDAVYCEVDETYCYYENAVELNNGLFAHNESDSYVYSHYEGTHYQMCNAIYSEYMDDYIGCSNETICKINGEIHQDVSKIITIDGIDYNVHEEVTYEELVEYLG